MLRGNDHRTAQTRSTAHLQNSKSNRSCTRQQTRRAPVVT